MWLDRLDRASSNEADLLKRSRSVNVTRIGRAASVETGGDWPFFYSATSPNPYLILTSYSENA